MFSKPSLGLISRGLHKTHPRYKGCVGHWLMNEGGGTTVFDASGYSNHGTLTNGVTWSSSTYGPCLSFDNVDDYVDCGSQSVLDDLRLITIIARITPLSGGEGFFGRIVDKRSSGGWTLYMNDSEVTNGLAFNQDFSTTGGSWAWGNAFPSISATDVYNIALRYDSTSTSNDPVAWVNGVQLSAPTELATPAGSYSTDAASPLVLGNQTSATRTFDGKIDIVRLYYGLLSDATIVDIQQNPFLEFELPRRSFSTATDTLLTRTGRLLKGVGL